MERRKLPEDSAELILAQIELILRRFQEISAETKVILSPESMPHAELQLKDVLKTTEESTLSILAQATAISMALQEENAGDALQEKVQACVCKIYEACSFQDLTGQRIKKVLGQINDIGMHLKRLSDIANHRGGIPAAPKKDPLLNGPQLTHEAPNQNDIDHLFTKAEA